MELTKLSTHFKQQLNKENDYLCKPSSQGYTIKKKYFSDYMYLHNSPFVPISAPFVT